MMGMLSFDDVEKKKKEEKMATRAQLAASKKRSWPVPVRVSRKLTKTALLEGPNLRLA
jgi:hypothetical protein